VYTFERDKLPPQGTLISLWGADGNQLVIWPLQGNGEFLSWVNVIHTESTD
jgi:hypothetical protein